MASTLLTVLAVAAVAVGCFVTGRRSPAAGFALVLVALIGASSSIGPVKELFLQVRWGALAGLATAFVWPLPTRAEATRSVLLVLSIPVVAVASAAWSIEPRLTILRALSFGTLLWVALAAMGPRFRSRGEEGRFVTALALVSAGVAVVSIATWAIVPGTAVYVGDLRGILENQNGLGLFLGLTYPFVAAAFDLRSPKRLRLLAVGAAYVGVIGLSESRSGLAAMIAAIVAYELAQRSYRRMLLQVAFVLAGFVFAASAPPLSSQAARDPIAPPANTPGEPPPLEEPERTTVFGGNTAPDQSRLSALLGARDEAWSASLDLIGERPVQGFGFGTGDRVFEKRPDVASFKYFQGANPNSGYLQAALELGLLGVVILAPLLFAFAASVRLARRVPFPPARSAFLGALAGGLVAAVFESVFTAAGAPWAAIVWLSAAALLAPLRPAAEDAA